MYSYLLWLAVFIFLPLFTLWIWHYQYLSKFKPVFLLTIVGSLIFAFPWDHFAIKEHIWYFTKPYIVGIWLFGLPLEEWLFIIFVTFLISTTTVLLWKKMGVKS